MSRCAYLLLVAISVTQVFGECKVCGSVSNVDQSKSFCRNLCAPDPIKCELETGDTACIWDTTKPKEARCVESIFRRRLCYFQDLEKDAGTGRQCPYVRQCAKNRFYCNKCVRCNKGTHKGIAEDDDRWESECYLAQKVNPKTGKASGRCIFNYREDDELKMDNCMAAPIPPQACVPGTPGIDMLYILEDICEDSEYCEECKECAGDEDFDGCDGCEDYEDCTDCEGVTWLEAQELCREMFNADLATIIYDEDLQNALEYIGFGASLWTGMRSTDPDYDFSPVDGTECPVYHHGQSCRGCTDRSLWQNGNYLQIKEGGSHCVRLVPEDGTITNDVDCDQKLKAVLCNCQDTASGTYIPPYPYNT
eukprot:173328_1